jgi:hypothetical protein
LRMTAISSVVWRSSRRSISWTTSELDAGRPRNGENCGGAALEADAEGNVLLLGQSDVFQ